MPPLLPYAFEPVRTERLTLRLMTAGDVDDILAYQSLEEVCRYVPFEPRDRAQVQTSVTAHAAATTLAADGDYWRPAVEVDGRVIGDLFFALKSVATATGEIGWTLHPGFQGRGYMTEGARALLDLLFGPLGLRRVTAVLDPRNAASIRLCERLGMRREAHHVEDDWFKGEWADTLVYALLAREWTSS